MIAAHVTTDSAEYDAAVAGFLERDPIGNTVALTVLGMLRAGGRYDDEPPWFAWAEDDGVVVGAAFRTPPYPVGLAAMEPQAAAAIGSACADRELPGASGRLEVVAAFAGGAGRTHEVRIDEVQHVLRELRPPPPVPGIARGITPDDSDVYVPWMHAFHAEAGLLAQADPVRSLEHRLRAGGALTLWCVGGRPVSMAGRSPAAGGIPRIGPVWTPPEHRRHGYAAAVTAAVCEDAFSLGATACTLFADATNATSNGVYERLGFAPVGRVVEAVLRPG